MAFVEKAGASFPQLKEEFLSSSEYQTQTAGERHTPAATPVGEGVYAITTTGRESHLVYMITIPEKLGEVQMEIGLKEKGSFVLSTKNPEAEAPPGTSLPKGAEYPSKYVRNTSLFFLKKNIRSYGTSTDHHISQNHGRIPLSAMVAYAAKAS